MIASTQGAVVTSIVWRKKVPRLFWGKTRYAVTQTDKHAKAAITGAFSPARLELFYLCFFSSRARWLSTGVHASCWGVHAPASLGIINQRRFERGHSGSPLSAGTYLGPSVTAVLIHTGMHTQAPPVVVIN